MLVFDVVDQKSFEKTREWMTQIKTNTQADKIGLILLGNKCDSEQRTVTTRWRIFRKGIGDCIL